jgi:hypothetical protein
VIFLYLVRVVTILQFQVSEELLQHFRHIALARGFKVQDANPLAKACIMADIKGIFHHLIFSLIQHFLFSLGYYLLLIGFLHIK